MKIVNTKEVLRVFADELNKRMEAKGMTYRQTALAARVTRGSMVHYKSGLAFPELHTLVLIAEYLECSVDELLGYQSDVKGPSNINEFANEKEFADYFRLRLCDYMELKTVDAKELARRSGISSTTIDMYLSVHRWVPRTADFLRICSALDCTPSELLGY